MKKVLDHTSARYEREATREYLQRRIEALGRIEGGDDAVIRVTLKRILTWVLTRQKRYDKRPGGL